MATVRVPNELWELVLSMGFHSGTMAVRLSSEGTLTALASDGPLCLLLDHCQFAAIFATKEQAQKTLRRTGRRGMWYRLRRVGYQDWVRSRGTRGWVPHPLRWDDPRVKDAGEDTAA